MPTPTRVRLPPEVHAALRRAAGLRPAPVWLVGGAIRDAALGREPRPVGVRPRLGHQGVAAGDAGVVVGPAGGVLLRRAERQRRPLGP
ncbi:MAG: hypothetical protein AAB262_11615, partial [Elusimicrobiota bacterium]